MHGVQRASFNADGIENRLEIRSCLQRDLIVGKEARRLCSSRQRPGDSFRLRGGREGSKPLQPVWSERITANRLDDPIEFEGPEGASVHRDVT